MIPVRLLSVATALPAHVVDQDEAADRAAAAFGGKVFRAPDVVQLFANTGIRTRRLVRPLEWYATPTSFEDRNAVYVEAAEALWIEAATKALSAAGVAPWDVGQVVTVSSTGIATPSLEARAGPAVGLAPTAKRTPVFGLGCAGGVGGLSLAARLAAAEPDKPVLFVTVELCSLSCRPDEMTKANVVATALFGDGAAAAVLQGGSGAKVPGPQRSIEAASEYLWPHTLDIMGWRIDPAGLGVVLDANLPRFVGERFHEAAEAFLGESGLARDDIARFVCHPGGARVLPAIEASLGLGEGALDIERAVLADYGNMSAPTVLFVLERVLAQGKAGPSDTGRLVLAALGPGFTASFLSLSPPEGPLA